MGSSEYSTSTSNSYQASFNSSGVIEIAMSLFYNKMDQGWTDFIKDKLRKEINKNPDLEAQIEKKFQIPFDKFALALGDEELFKEIFLLPRYKPDLILEEIDEELKQVKDFEEMGCPLTENEVKETIKRINDRKTKLSEHKFELILTECQASDNKNILFRNIVNNVYEFGALHSALSLDGTIIEWGRGPCGDSLVVPAMDMNRFLFAFEVKAREDKGFFAMLSNKIKNAAKYVLDLFSGGAFGRWSVGRANEKKLDKIAKICVMFNRSRFYNPLSLNCQHFVKQILKAIESDFSSDGEFRNIIDRLDKEGKVDFIFKGREFKTRKELDDYVKSINFDSLCRNDKKLLICYKNTFDVYLLNDQNNERYKTTDEARKYWNELIRKENFND